MKTTNLRHAHSYIHVLTIETELQLLFISSFERLSNGLSFNDRFFHTGRLDIELLNDHIIFTGLSSVCVCFVLRLQNKTV